MSRVAIALLAGLALAACEKAKPPTPEAAPTASESAAAISKKSDQDEDEPEPAIVAYAPGEGPPDAAEAIEQQPRTGVCSMLDTGFDGADTRSTERLIVKVKDDRIVAAEYSYRGSYALDGKVESLSIPLRDGKWLEFEMPMTSGTKQFKLKLKSDVVDFKGTAAQDKQGSCTWEKPPAPKKKRR
jgi:hypothetical protein